MSWLFLSVVLLLSVSVQAVTIEQIHVTYGGKTGSMYFGWMVNNVSTSNVKIGTTSNIYTIVQPSNTQNFYHCGTYYSAYIHHANVNGLNPVTKYYYTVGDDSYGWSDEYSFTTPAAAGDPAPFTIGVVGDLGQTSFSKQTVDLMTTHTEMMAVVHVGDLSYADQLLPRWDSWQRMAQPLLASFPYMTLVGNHDVEKSVCNHVPFYSYNQRFQMPFSNSESNNNEWYSFKMSGAHFIMLSSYSPYDENSEQYKWLLSDLEHIDRSVTPWVIAAVHAPWYNSNYVHQGEGELMRKSMEPLLYKYGVNLVLAGHVHAYERSYPSYNFQRDDVNGMTYIVIGDGGNREGLATLYIDPQPVWSAFRQAEYGFGSLTFFNSSVLEWQWMRNQDGGHAVTDSVYIHNHSN